MSKTIKAESTHYEILFILPNKFTDDEAKTLAGWVEKTLVENGATITATEYWGKKKLAYEIKHNAYGYYGLFEFDLEGKNLAKIDNSLRLSADVLRHQIVVKPKKSAEDLARAKVIRAKIDSKKAEAEKVKAEGEKKASATLKSKEKEKDTKKVDLKDLDEKLEGILNADDLI